jgi:hypothetical protein
MFALDIKKGRYGRIRLNGLHLVGAHGDKSVVWYIDDHATPGQFAALKAIAKRLQYRTDLPAFFQSAQITQEITDTGNHVEVARHGGFKANYLRAFGRKGPIVVENMARGISSIRSRARPTT